VVCHIEPNSPAGAAADLRSTVRWRRLRSVMWTTSVLAISGCFSDEVTPCGGGGCGYCLCHSNGWVECTTTACGHAPGVGGDTGTGGAGGTGGALIIVAARGSSTEGGAVSIDAGSDGPTGRDGGIVPDAMSTLDGAAPFPGGTCDRDTCTDGQICLSVRTVSGQYNPAGGSPGVPTVQTTKSCRTVPSACGMLGSCSEACCKALCGGGSDAMCACSLTSTSGGCSVGLP
jgi:hypothetical protein